MFEILQAGTDVFRNPDFTVSDDNTLYIHDDMDERNYIFDVGGRFIKTFARKGEGPGEVVLQLGAFCVNDTFIAAGKTKMHYFSKDGQFIKALHTSLAREFPQFFIDDHNYLSVSLNPILIIRRNWPGQGEIRHIDLKSGHKRTLLSFTFSDKPSILRNGWDSRIPGLHAYMVTGFDYERKIVYYGLNDSYRIHAMDLRGKKLLTFSVRRDRQPISKKRVIDGFDGQPKALKMLIKDFPLKMVHFSRILVIDGLIYVFGSHYGPRQPEMQIDIFSRDGRYLYRSSFSHGSGRDIYFPLMANNIIIKNSHLYAAFEDDEGELGVAKYKVSLPKINE